MAEFLNPELPLDDLGDFFADAADDGGIEHLDPVLCGHFAAGLREVAANVRLLVARAVEAGLLERLAAAPASPRRRTRIESRILAGMAAPLDPAGRVVVFPIPGTDGGTAA